MPVDQMPVHEPVIPPKVFPSRARVDPQLLQRVRDAYLCAVADAVGALYTMDSGIRPLYDADSAMIGQALTVKAVPGDNLAVHGAFSMVQAGDVLVIDWRGFTAAGASGAGSVVVPAANGLAGIVVDGAYRDVDEMRTLGVPLFGRAINPSSPAKSRVGEINVAVSCGGVVVQPGDVVMGTIEGVVVIPADDLEGVASVLETYQRPTGVEHWDIGERLIKYELRGNQYRAALARQRERTNDVVAQ